MVDAAGTEGRDPIADIRAINAELEAYNPELLKRPMVIAANKIDAVYSEDEDPVEILKQEFEPEGIKVFPISAVSGKGVKELLYAVYELLKTVNLDPVIFEKEFEIEYAGDRNLPYTVEQNEDGEFVVEDRASRRCWATRTWSLKGIPVLPEILKREWYFRRA